jgi:hypothetical protein
MNADRPVERDLTCYLQRLGFQHELLVGDDVWQECVASEGATAAEVEQRARRLAISVEIMFGATQASSIAFDFDVRQGALRRLRLDVASANREHVRFHVRLESSEELSRVDGPTAP